MFNIQYATVYSYDLLQICFPYVLAFARTKVDDMRDLHASHSRSRLNSCKLAASFHVCPPTPNFLLSHTWKVDPGTRCVLSNF